MLTQLSRWFKNVKALVERRDVYIMLIIIFVASASFGLGKISNVPVESTSVHIEDAFQNIQNIQPVESDVGVVKGEEVVVQGSFVGSKNSDKYHYPWCPGAQRIKKDNEVWFFSREDAESAGYTPAKNCKGL